MVYKTICSVFYLQLNALTSITRLEKTKKQACWCFSCSFSRVEDTQQRAQWEHGHRNGKQTTTCMPGHDPSRRNRQDQDQDEQSFSLSLSLCCTSTHSDRIDMNPACKRPQWQALLLCFTIFLLFLLVCLSDFGVRTEDCWHYFSSLLLSAFLFHSTWFSCRRRFFIFP